ncbi:MAG: PD-(D/E)XK nuclease family protein [Candidatus Bathyarchaeota archaeon]|nr:PD-(D/E)XK nuclease family protein [Candidatus Bathyarchaeota archaeon]
MAKKYPRDRVPYLSYSGWQKYMACPQSYYLEYIAGQRPDIQDARNFFTGNALHKTLEDYLANGEDNPQWIADNAADYWHEELEKQTFVEWRHDNDKRETFKKMKTWSVALVDLIKQAKIKPSEWEPEFKADSNVVLKGREVRLGGRIDLMRRKENGDVIFFDLKCSENRSIMKLDQITWYALLLGIYLDDFSQPIAGGYLLPGFKEIKMFKVSEQAKIDLLNRIDAAFTGIENKEWETKPENSKCWFCNVKHACPLYGGLTGVDTGIVELGK